MTPLSKGVLRMKRKAQKRTLSSRTLKKNSSNRPAPSDNAMFWSTFPESPPEASRTTLTMKWSTIPRTMLYARASRNMNKKMLPFKGGTDPLILITGMIPITQRIMTKNMY